MRHLKIPEGWYQVQVFTGRWEFAYWDGLYFTCEFGPITKIKYKNKIISLEEES